MALSSEDWRSLNSHFQKIDAMNEAFHQHVLDDRDLAEAIRVNQSAIATHLEECRATKARKKKTWYFWLGIVAAILAPVIASLVEHIWFASHIASITQK